jgi:SAM-dependent methyltransferase
MDSPSPRESNLRRPHPLAVALIQRLQPQPHARVLEIGCGSGRNTDALHAAGFSVHTVSDETAAAFTAQAQGFDAAISTHALLHGTPASIARTVQEIARSLSGGAAFYATFASKADARYGTGTRVAEDAYAPDEGAEQGVAHAYFHEAALRELVSRYFVIEAIEEHRVDDVVGRWAHEERPSGSVHWYVRAVRQ